MLSAGCLEEDLKWKAKQVLESGKAQIYTYDMQDETDLSWGQGAGCNGILHIFIEPLTRTLRQNLMKLKAFLDAGISVLHIKQFNGNFEFLRGGYFPQNGEPFGDAFPAFMIEKLFGKSDTRSTDKNGQFYSYHYRSRPRLILFGAGPDAKPLVRFAAQTGFSVTVYDHRPALCNRENFPEAEQCITGFPDGADQNLDIVEKDFAVIMTHNFQKDKELLRILMHKKLSYLGILGPCRRTERLLEGKEIPPWISSPAGINIHAKGAEEIAISIIAEMIKVLRKPEKI